MDLRLRCVHSEHHIISGEKRQVPIYRPFLRSSEHNGYYVYCLLISTKILTKEISLICTLCVICLEE
jgi:hypothetical protein